MTAAQHMVQANGIRFRVLVDGPPEGELVIMLHGFPEGADSWGKQINALARAGALAIAPDLRGFGLTDLAPKVEDYAIDTLIEDVASLIRAFGRDSAHVAGHDWGSVVAWNFASAHAEMTKSLTALSVGHPAAALEARADQDQRKASEYIGLFLIEGKAEEVLARDDYRWARDVFGEALPRSATEHYIESIRRPGRLTAGLNYYRANFSHPREWAQRALQLKISAPTVLLWGDQDPFLRRTQAEKTASHMLGEYRLQVLEGAGHWLQFERPDEVSAALIGAVR